MNFTTLKKQLIQAKITAKIAVAQAEGEEIFTALKAASDENLCFPILVGNPEKIAAAVKHFDLRKFAVIEAVDSVEAASRAVQAVREHQADLLMKGNLSTDILLKAVLHKTEGLRTGSLLSHLAVFETAKNKFLGITDGGININPDLKAKVSIINNAVGLFHKLGIAEPCVAILSAIEKVNPDMPSTMDAAALVDMANHGEIKGAKVAGPVAFDLAVSAHARQVKNFTACHEDADIIIAPEIVCGNAVSKALVYVAQSRSGGVILGAACPIILLSRSDSAAEKFNSIVLGISACATF